MKINLNPSFMKSGRTPEWFREAYPFIVTSLAEGKTFEEIHQTLLSRSPKTMRTRNGAVTQGNLTNMTMRWIRLGKIPDFSHLKGFRQRVYVNKESRAYTPTPSETVRENTVVSPTPIVEAGKNKGSIRAFEKDVRSFETDQDTGTKLKAIRELVTSNLSDEIKLRYIQRELNG